METPLVSVICLSFNHERFIEEAVQSVLDQTYSGVELIIVDDASTDSSQKKIKEIVLRNPSIKTLLLNQNVGNCKAFNQGLALAKGQFIIDFAADDVLMPSRVEKGVNVLQGSGADFGVHFSDAEWIDENGMHLYWHSDKFPHSDIPQGDVYKDIIRKYFICPSSTMARREVFEDIKGYDERLAYEDFDFLIRSSRRFKFVYSPDVLVKKRVTKNALARKQFEFFSRAAKSTFVVCEKILDLNKSTDEQKALRQRILHEIRSNIRLLNPVLVKRYLLLLRKNWRKVY